MIHTTWGGWTRRKIRRGLGWLGTTYVRQVSMRGSQTTSAATRTLEWIRRHESPSGGIYVHSRHSRAYPEVTGYLIPTLLQYGERELATRLLCWLIRVQRDDGAFADPYEGQPNVFDTGQALRGLLAGADLVPQVLHAARRAADYLCGEMRDRGRGGFGPRYRGEIPETIHLYALPPLYRTAEAFQEPRYRIAAERCLAYYRSHEDALHLGSITHYLAYELEALIDLGCADQAIPVLDRLRAEQDPDGGVSGSAGVRWVCAPGLAQLAVCWYKLDQWEPADQAMRWLEAHQSPSGCFRGGYGENVTYCRSEGELSWAAKFFLDAHLWRVRSFFNRKAAGAASLISRDDHRVKAILSVARSGDRILEIGCGRGHLLQALQEVAPGLRCTGVDIAPALLASVPSGIRTLQGSLETIPCPDNSFDVVVSRRAIEHSANMPAAVGELVRVARPGGWVVIIHGQHPQHEQEDSCSWQRRPSPVRMPQWLGRDCEHVSMARVSENGARADGLVVWKAQKKGQSASVTFR